MIRYRPEFGSGRRRATPTFARPEGPLSIIAASAARCAALSLEGCPGDLRFVRPSDPLALNFATGS